MSSCDTGCNGQSIKELLHTYNIALGAVNVGSDESTLVHFLFDARRDTNTFTTASVQFDVRRL